MRKLLLAYLVLSVMFANLAICQTIKYVKPVATGTGDGSSWANATDKLKSTIDGAASNTQIWVAAGTYKPTGTNTRTISFVLKNGVATYGGFAGTETLLTQRNWVKYISILSGDIGVAGSMADNSYHVVSNDGNNLDNTALLDGFTITAGNANGQGGGIYNYTSGPAFTNCIISGNQAIDGGGAANLDGKALYTNCSFMGNAATTTGGAILNYKATGNAKFVNCSISGNQAATGGAVYNYLANAVFVNCISWGNSSEIANEASTVPSVSYSDVQGGYTGTANIATDPKFAAQPAVGLSSKGNLHLLLCSPAINVGNSGQNSSTLDLSGNARKNGTIDMGAYERPANAIAGIVFVEDNGPLDGGDGTSWGNAFTSLQDALAAGSCAGYTQVWVAAGTYKPTSGTDRSISFVMKNNLAIYGGFSGTETLLAQRNANTNISILSGDIGVAGNITDNSYHIIVNYGLNNTAVLDGFTLTAGNANNQATYGNGGGIYNYTASPTITHCSFTGNTAKSGPAIFNTNASSPAITYCSFIENQTIDGTGGALENISSSTPVISNCSFIGNICGGIYNNMSSPTITNCSFIGNQAKFYGGGIQNVANAVITNCIFIGNKAGTSGGGIYNTGQTSIINCSFSGNEAATGGGIFNSNNQSIAIINSIINGNSSEIINDAGASANVTYSIVKGGYAGTGDLDVDPQFLQQPPIGPGTTGDLRLLPCSPAINAGDDAANTTTIDLDGNPRKFSTIDMGAYERKFPKPTTWYLDSAATGTGDGSSWANAFTNLATALTKLTSCTTSDTLLIAKGTYSTGAPFEFDRLQGVILGGYPTGGGTRDAAANPVIIQGVVNVLKPMRVDGVKVSGQ